MTQPPNEQNPNNHPHQPSLEALRENLKQYTQPKKIGPLIIRTAAESIAESKLKPTPKKLFGSMFFENEVTFLFGDTNTGKSILAVQIGDAISKGISTCMVPNECDAQKVLYFDFELSDKQFERRYIDDRGNAHRFSSNFYRVSLDMDEMPPEDNPHYEKWLNDCIEQAVIITNAKVLIVDNLTFIRSDTERARDAGPLMKHLKRLKSVYNLSLLILAHTPKRDRTAALTERDLQGSSQLANFADGMFAIGNSTMGTDYRYVVQLKTRSGTKDNDHKNVITCRLEKQTDNLKFEALGFCDEQEHLQFVKEPIDKDNRQELMAQVKKLSEDGLSHRQIAAQLNISKSVVNKYLGIMQNS